MRKSKSCTLCLKMIVHFDCFELYRGRVNTGQQSPSLKEMYLVTNGCILKPAPTSDARYKSVLIHFILQGWSTTCWIVPISSGKWISLMSSWGTNIYILSNYGQSYTELNVRFDWLISLFREFKHNWISYKKLWWRSASPRYFQVRTV